MFKDALFIKAKIQKQKCPSTNDQTGIFIQRKIQQYKHRTTNTCNNMDAYLKKLLQVKEIKHKRATTAGSIYMKFQKRLIYNDQKEISAFPELESGQGQTDWVRAQGKFWGWWECSINLDSYIISQVHTSVKIHQNVLHVKHTTIKLI